MNSNLTSQTEVRTLRSGEANYTAEAERIQSLALAGKCHVVKLGDIVFFSTQTGDAWMVDWKDHCAICLARDFERHPIPIQESAQRMVVAWDANYQIDGHAFTVAERTGNVRTILGYPTAQIERVLAEALARPESVSPDAALALARLNTGRNEACPCASGKKYKKCCLAKDEAVARKFGSLGLRAGDLARMEAAADPLIQAGETASPAQTDELADDEEEEDEEDEEIEDEEAFSVEARDDLSAQDIQLLKTWGKTVNVPYIEERNGGEVLRQVTEFLDAHPRLFSYLELEEELLLELGPMLGEQGRYADYIALLQRVRQEQPEVYEGSFGWFDYALIADAVARGARAEIPQFFSFFQAVEDPDNHLERVLDLLAWTGCEAELFQLAGDTVETGAPGGEWPWHPSARWLCLREAIPCLQTGAESLADAEHLLEAQRKALGLAPEVSGDIKWLHDQLRCSAIDPVTWKMPSLPGREGIGFSRVSWNFSGWLARERGRGWVRSSFLGRLLWQYWAFPTHRRNARDPFHLQPEQLEQYFNRRLGGDLWPESVSPFAFLQGVVWFGEYLVTRKDWTEARLAELREMCARLYSDLYDRPLSTDVAVRLYPDFEALVR